MYFEKGGWEGIRNEDLLDRFRIMGYFLMHEEWKSVQESYRHREDFAEINTAIEDRFNTLVFHCKNTQADFNISSDLLFESKIISSVVIDIMGTACAREEEESRECKSTADEVISN